MLSVVSAGFSGVDLSILYLSCKGENSQKVFGIYDSMSMAGLLLAASVFSLFVKDNFPLAGFLTVVSYGIAALLSLGLTEVRQPQQERTQAEGFRTLLWDTLQNRKLILFLIAVALLSETHQTITVFLNQLQYGRCGMDSSVIGFVYILATILGLLGVYSAALTRRMTPITAFSLFCGLAIGSCLVLALTTAAIPSVAGILTLRATNTLFQPFQANFQNKMVRSQNRATALSIHSMVVSFVAIGTNLIFGALTDWSLPGAFLFGGGICGLSLLLFSLWNREMRQF